MKKNEVGILIPFMVYHFPLENEDKNMVVMFGENKPIGFFFSKSDLDTDDNLFIRKNENGQFDLVDEKGVVVKKNFFLQYYYEYNTCARYVSSLLNTNLTTDEVCEIIQENGGFIHYGRHIINGLKEAQEKINNLITIK